MPEPNSRDAPTVIILYGGTGDLAKRMVLPAIYELFSPRPAAEAVPPGGQRPGRRGARGLPGPRPRVAGRVRARRSTCPGSTSSPSTCSSPAAGSSKSDPGSLLDVIAEAERELGGKPALIHYLAVPPSAFAPTTEAIKEHGLAENAKAVYEKPYGTSTASFHELDELVHSDLRRGAGLPDRPLPREGGDPEPAPGPVRQPAVRGRVERRPPRAGADRRARDPGHRRPRRVLRRHRGGAGHAGHPPVPGGGRGRDGAAAEHGGRRPAGRPGGGDLRVPPAGPGRGGARAVPDLPADRGHRARLDHRHLRRRPAVDRHRPLAGRAVPAADRQEDGGQRPAGQPDLPAGRGPAALDRAVSRTCWPSTSRATGRSRSR